MAGTGVDDAGGDDDVGGAAVDTGGNAAAAVGLNEALSSSLGVADKKAKAAVHTAMAPMSATESHLLVVLALAGAAAACAAPSPMSHVATI